MFDHQKLRVYSKALDIAVELDTIARALPGRSDLQDQLTRAGASIVLNIAEGASEYSLADKARFFRIARRFAAECSAILDLAERLSPGLSKSTAQSGLHEVASILSVLIRRPPPRPKA